MLIRWHPVAFLGGILLCGSLRPIEGPSAISIMALDRVRSRQNGKTFNERASSALTNTGQNSLTSDLWL